MPTVSEDARAVQRSNEFVTPQQIGAERMLERGWKRVSEQGVIDGDRGCSIEEWSEDRAEDEGEDD